MFPGRKTPTEGNTSNKQEKINQALMHGAAEAATERVQSKPTSNGKHPRKIKEKRNKRGMWKTKIKY